MRTLRYAALAGNVVFILWMLYNAIDDGFSAIGTIQGAVPLALAILLLINTLLLLRR